MLEISSRSNEKIKFAVHLGESASFRNERNKFFLEGARLCSDAVLTGVKICTAFFTEKALGKYPEYIKLITDAAEECCKISPEIASKLAMTDGAQGVFCICETGGSKSSEPDYKGRYIALENIQDPSNLGAVCRSAEALGVGLIVSGGCDLYNPKALRAAMGSSLRLNVINTPSLPELIEKANQNGMLTLASTPLSTAEDIGKVKKSGGIICCVGNEGNGLSAETMNACSLKVTIPMSGRAESLNASAAAAILIWEIAERG